LNRFGIEFFLDKEGPMKKAGWIFVFIVLALATACLVYVPYDEQGGPGPRSEGDYRPGGASMDVSYFYDALSPYGDWVDYPSYGYVWIPRHMGFGWRPYTHGRWVWTNYGWTWISSYEWGWAPFHYGRWGFDRGLGWFWVPDNVWGPAWVTWRYGDFYCGWAPLPPGVAFSAQYGIGSGMYDVPDYAWIFIDGRYFLDERLDRWVLPYERNITIFNFASVRAGIRAHGGRAYDDGVDLDHVRRMTRRNIDVFELRDANRPGYPRVESRDVVIHRPTLSPNQLARPKKFVRKDVEVQDIEGGADEDETTLRNEHDRQLKLLEESQKIEINSIRRKIDEDKNRAVNTGERTKIEEEYTAKVADLKKKHDTEKVSLTERQKREADKAKKGRIRKKD
jgi:hypothetical protein